MFFFFFFKFDSLATQNWAQLNNNTISCLVDYIVDTTGDKVACEIIRLKLNN